MPNRIQTITARAIMYVLPIGGLLSLISAIVWFGWNHLLQQHLSLSDITFLESFGIVAIGYVGYSAIAFALDESVEQENWVFPLKNDNQALQKTNTATEETHCKIPRHAEQLSLEEKIILREKIARCCGDVCKGDEKTPTPLQEKEFILTP
jgi:hypothetical protein